MKRIANKMLQLGLTIILTACFAFAFGQNGNDYVTVNGIVKDSKSRDVIQFASISIPNTNIGTVTNSEGEFTLKVPSSLNATEFEISHIGFANSRYKIQPSNGKPTTYFIDPQVLSLQEVIVRPETPEMLVKMAIDDISKNYSLTPTMMQAFYRETVKQKRDYLAISEAVVDIYKTPYNSFANDRVKIFKGRKGVNIKKADTLMVKLQGGPAVSLLLDVVKNPDFLFSREIVGYYKYEMVGMVNIDNKINYVISFQPVGTLETPLFYGKFYINQESLALTMAEFNLDLNDKQKAENFFILRKPTGVSITPTSTSYMVNYKKQPNGKYYVNYVRNEIKFKADWKRRWFNSYYTIMSEMAITNIDTKAVEKIPNDEAFKASMVLNDRIQDLQDENFWGSSNIIEPEQSIQNAIKKITKQMIKAQQ